MVDGAHAFGMFDFSIRDLDCDYYGTSLHKWLSAPLGAGFLYVRKDKIRQIWPMFAHKPTPEDDIERLNHTGTHPAHTDLAIANAIEYQNLIGMERKEARLRYLQTYWTDRVRDLDHIDVFTPRDRQRGCAIGTVGIKGMDPAEMAQRLINEFGIFTVAIDRGEIRGCRICPNVFTTLDELDTFVSALKAMG